VDDFLKSAAAIEPILNEAVHQPLGVTILCAIEATRTVVDTNTNLGIVLLLAPLASVPLELPLRSGVKDLLARATVEDACQAYRAIRLAQPGGLGQAESQDVQDEPTLPLRDVMALAKDRDLIARQYAEDFEHLLECIVADLVQRVQYHHNIERAIVESQITLLAVWKDSLIARKLGDAEAERVRQAALRIPVKGDVIDPQAYRAFDAWLRSENHARNPGTTADLIAAALFVALRDQRIDPSAPFTWSEHPFDVRA
jgi:triphosphoribosyl-dephospho-CoA synthase